MYRSINRTKQSKSCFLFPPLSLHRLHGLCLTKTGVLKFFPKTPEFLTSVFLRPKSEGKPLEIIKYPKNLEQNDNHRVLTSFPRWLKKSRRVRNPGRIGDKNSEQRWLQSLFLAGGWVGGQKRTEPTAANLFPRQRAFQNTPGFRGPESNNSFPSLSSQHCWTELDVEDLILDLQTLLAEKFPNSTPHPQALFLWDSGA